ncbi:MAG: hypothetical protein K2H65_02400, partial [Bacteroidales bacterium]|nr:hypothetical protein [Bacteroidales bacterium]
MKGLFFSPAVRRGILIAWVATAAALFCGCPGPDEFRKVPVPPVQIRVYPYCMDNELGPVGSAKLFPNYGYAGIIVYHFTETEYLAYDLACPNDYEYGCKVTYHPELLQLFCEGCAAWKDCQKGCGTVYIILTGFPE